MPEFLRRVQEMQSAAGGAASQPPKTETLVAAAAAGIAIFAAGGTSALGVAVTREPLFALLGSTAAFGALKAIEALAPKMEEFQQAQEKARRLRRDYHSNNFTCILSLALALALAFALALALAPALVNSFLALRKTHFSITHPPPLPKRRSSRRRR